MEVLENIEEGTIEITKLSSKPSPLSKGYDPDRITDYPRAQSPESTLSQSPINGSRRSSLSLSAISESSFTSDGSSVLSYDANKLPKKKILKNPHRLRRYSKNRVRWKLPGEEDSDTASLQSFDSVSTSASDIYGRVRSGISEVRSNWREFEKNPLPGSTGLTPAKPPRNSYHPGLHSHSNSSLFNGSPMVGSFPDSSSLHSLLGGAPHLQSNYHSRSASASSLPQIAVNGDSLPGIGKGPHHAFHRSLSPLASSTVFHPPNDSSPSGTTLHSTPRNRFHSDSSLLQPVRKGLHNLNRTHNSSNGTHNLNRTHNLSGTDDDTSISDACDIDFPILKLDENKIGELEESTSEDRKRMHMFKFPQNTPIRSVTSSSTSSVLRTNTVPAVAKVFLDDDDANDYDHLSPKEADQESDMKEVSPKKAIDQLFEFSKQKKKPKEEEREDRSLKSIHQLVGSKKSAKSEKNLEKEVEGDLYSDKDIDDALNVIASECDTDDSDGSTVGDSSFKEEQPPIIPPKVRRKQPVEQEEERTDSPGDDGSGDLSLLVEEGVELNWTINKACSGLAGLNTNTDSNASTEQKDDFKPIDVQERDGNALQDSDSISILQERENVITQQKEPHTGSGGRRVEKKVEIPSTREEGSESTGRMEKTEPVPNWRNNLTPADETLPPVVPIKTVRIRRQDRDERGSPLDDHVQYKPPSPPPPLSLGTDQSSTKELKLTSPSHPLTASAADDDNEAHTEDLLPPPPEFASPLSFELLDSSSHVLRQQQRAGWITPPDEALSSTSNSTLVPDTDESVDIRREALDTDTFHSNSSSPSLSSYATKKHSWKEIHSKTIKDQSFTKTETLSSSSTPSSASNTTPLSMLRGESTDVADVPKRPSDSPPPPPLPLISKKVSMETAYTEGNLIKNHSTSRLSSSHKRHTPTNHVMAKGTYAPLKRVPHRPAPLPPPPPPKPVKRNIEKPPPRDQKVLELTYRSNGKPPRMTKPTVYDTEKCIQEMLTEINSEENRSRRANPPSYGEALS